MLKRIASGCAILFILSLSVGACPKLEGHWAERELDLKFMGLYLPSLVQNNYSAFDPDGAIQTADFQYALLGLADFYGYELKLSIQDAKPLRRKDAALLVASTLINNGLLKLHKNLPNPFLDLNRLTADEQDNILTLNAQGVLRGSSKNLFMPGAVLTQSQATVLLQRVERIFAKENIPFQVISTKTTYSSREEGMFVEEGKDKVQIEITKVFPTPGYSMEVKRITKGCDQYELFISTKRPAADTILLQVITYQTIVLEIDKKALTPPYLFKIIQ